MPTLRPWSARIARLFKSAKSKKQTPFARAVARLSVEHLEDRAVPAITILDSGVGSLDALFATDTGTLSGAQTTGAQTLSRAALQGIGSTVNISLASDAISFNALSSPLALPTGAGHTDSFTATAGDIAFANAANTLTTAGGSLSFSASGNLFLGNLNTGQGSVVATATSGAVTTNAINATGITETAGSLIAVHGPITSSGAVTLTANGGSITSGSNVIQTSSQLALTAVGGIAVTTQAVQLSAQNSGSGDIVVNQTPNPTQALEIVSSGVHNTAVGGMISITNGSTTTPGMIGGSISLDAGANIDSTNGAITLTAADVQINGSINSGTATTTLAPTDGQNVDLGTNTVGKFGVAQSEINNITAGNLRIGANNSGTFMVTAPIVAGANVGNTLTLISGATMTNTSGAGGGGITATNLRLSGTGPIALDNTGSGNNVANLVADLGPSPAGALFFSDGTNALNIGANIDGDTGITSANGNVTLEADSLTVPNVVNVGTGIVTFEPFTTARVITVGAGATGLGITDADLAEVTASEVRIGNTSFNHTGTITIDGAVTRHNFPILALFTGNATAGAVSQTAALSVAQLNVETLGGNVTLVNANNTVDTLAANLTGAAGSAEILAFQDFTGFTIGDVAGDSGLVTDTSTGTSQIRLTAGGFVNQSAGANIITNGLLLLGTGFYDLANPGNSVTTLAANLTTNGNSSLTYTNAGALIIGTVNGVQGVNVVNSAIDIETVNGNLTINNNGGGADVNAGTSTVRLVAGDTAGPGGPESVLTLVPGAVIVGTGGITLLADNMTLGAGGVINGGSSTVTLAPFESGVTINLGGADAVNTLGLTNAEIDDVTNAGVLVIGSSTAGNISITAQIAPAGTTNLQLVTGGSITDTHNSFGDLTVTSLGLTAVTGIGVSGPFFIYTAVSNLEAQTATGGIDIANVNGNAALNIGGVSSSLHGVQDTVSGDINLYADGTIDITTNGKIVKAAGNVLVNTVFYSNTADIVTGGTNSGTSGNGAIEAGGTGTATVASGRDVLIGGSGTFGDVDGGGSVAITAGRNVTISSASFVDAHGTGTVSITTGAGGAFTESSGRVTTQNANASVTADLMTIGGGGINAGTGIVTLDTVTKARTINIGTTVAGTLSLLQSDLGNITASVLRVGSAADTGNIQLAAPITLTSASVPVLDLATGGAIADTDATVETDLTVQSLALQAVSGIGTTAAGGSINVAVTNLAASNGATAGSIVVNNTSPTLNITTVDGVVGVANNSNNAGSVIAVDTTGTMNVLQNVFDANNVDNRGVTGIQLEANGAFNLAASTNVQVGDTTGNDPSILIESNANTPNGTADITLGAGAQILTTGDITLNADPDGNGIGGGINLPPTALLAGPSGSQAFDITLIAGKDITVTNLSASDNITITTSANILGDGSNSTVLNAGNNINLTAGGRIGASTELTAADIESASTAAPTTAYQSMVDVEYGGTLNLAQTGPLGDIAIRVLNAAGLNLSTVTGAANSLVGTGNQLALVSVNGPLTDDTNFVVNGANNADLFLATVNGNNIVLPNNTTSIVNNGATATTTLIASGSNTAAITAPTPAGSANITVQNLVLDTTGGTIGTNADPLEFNAVTLSGFTNGTVNNVAASGGSAVLTDTQNGVAVGKFNAGTGNVSLTSLGDIQSGTGAGSSIISLTPNSGNPAIIGSTVTLTTTAAPASGATGQIGYFTGGAAQFFEVQATTLNAATNNSRVWISAIGGTTVGTINVGTDTAILKTVNGNLLGSHATGTPDVIAGQGVNLLGTSGGFGATGAPLQINSPVLSANVSSGTGDIDVLGLNVAGLTVNKATTVSGAVNISDMVGNLQLGSATATGTIVTATGNISLGTSAGNILFGTAASTATILGTTGGNVTVTATGGGVVNNVPLSVLDIVGTSLNASGTGVGTSGAPLETAVATLTGSGGTGGVFVANTGDLALNAVSATGAGNIGILTTGSATVNSGQTVSAGTGSIALSAGANVTLSATSTVTTTGTVTINSDTAGAGSTVTVAPTATLSAGGTGVTVNGGTGADTFNLQPIASVPLTVHGGLPTTTPGDVLNLNLTGATGTVLNYTGVGAGNFTFTNRGTVTFDGIESLAPSTPVAVSLNLATLGFQDGNANPDIVNISSTGGANPILNVTVQNNSAGTPVSIFSGAVSGVSSFSLVGSTDPQTFIVDETNSGLPPININGNGPAGDTLVVNTTNATGPVLTPNGPNAGTFTFSNRASITYTNIANVANAVVTVTASIANASETGTNQAAQPGQFTFTRFGNLSSALTISYSVGGTAASGTNYQPLSGTVTFAAGAATATVTVSPIHTSVIGGPLTVTVTVLPGAGYTFVSGASATVTIANNNGALNSRFAVGSATGGLVSVYQNGSQTPYATFQPFPGYTGGLEVALGDVNGDGIPDLVVTNTTGPTFVAVFDGATGALLYAFQPLPGYSGGVSIAVGDVLGIGRADIIVGLNSVLPAFGIFDGLTGAFIRGVLAFPGLNAPVHVAVADLNGSGKDTIIATPATTLPVVALYDGNGNSLGSFYGFNPAIANVGLTVGSADLDGNGKDEILLGTVINGVSYVLVYNPDLSFRGVITLPVLPATSISAQGPQLSGYTLNGGQQQALAVTDGQFVGLFSGSLAFLSGLDPFPTIPDGDFIG